MSIKHWIREPEYNVPCDVIGTNGGCSICQDIDGKSEETPTVIFNDPNEFDEAECEACGKADRLAGVNPQDCPYAAGFPVYAWEKGYHGAEVQVRL